MARGGKNDPPPPPSPSTHPERGRRWRRKDGTPWGLGVSRVGWLWTDPLSPTVPRSAPRRIAAYGLGALGRHIAGGTPGMGRSRVACEVFGAGDEGIKG